MLSLFEVEWVAGDYWWISIGGIERGEFSGWLFLLGHNIEKWELDVLWFGGVRRWLEWRWLHNPTSKRGR